MAQATLVKRGAYHDSVALLTLARALRARPGVREAAVVMGTPANCDLLAQAGLLTEEARAATPNDLVVVVEAETPAGSPAAAAHHGGRHPADARGQPGPDLGARRVRGRGGARGPLGRPQRHPLERQREPRRRDRAQAPGSRARAPPDGPGLRHRVRGG